MSATLEFVSIAKVFGSGPGATTALAGVTFTVEPGTFTAVVGPSGCGKTTLLNIAAGLDSVYEGTFSFRPSDAVVAYLFQTPRLLPWLSARRNVAFPLEAKGLRRREAEAKAEEILRVVGLGQATGRYPSQLSGGMQQRVAIARALVIDPSLLLMDEPFSSLDELTARRLRVELAQLHQQLRPTVLMVTHNLHEACLLADRVIVMSGRPGTVVADIGVEVARPRSEDDVEVASLAKRLYGSLEQHDELSRLAGAI